MVKRTLLHRQREWLLGELAVWSEQGVISADQSDRILALYESPGAATERRQSHAILVLMCAAAVLCGLSLLLLVGYNWSEMTPAWKLGLAFAAVLAAHAGGFYLRYRQSAKLLSEAAFFFGCLLYGVGVAVVADVFNLGGHPPDAVWWWAIGVVPFALCLDTLLLHGLLVAILALWAGMEVLGYGYLGGWFFGRWNFLPNGAFTLPVLALPGLIWGYRKTSVVTVGMYAALLAWWGVLQPFGWNWDFDDFPTVFGVMGGVAAMLLAVAAAHRDGSPFAMPYRVFGVLLAGGLLIPLSFHEAFEELIDDWDARSSDRFAVVRALIMLAIPLATIGYVVWRDYKNSDQHAARQHDGPPQPAWWRDTLDRLWLPGALLIVMNYVAFSGMLKPFVSDPVAEFTPLGYPAVVGAILCNAGMLALAWWLMQRGLREDRGLFFTAGVLYFLLWSVLRYFDLFGDFAGMLGASILFFLCAAALFGVGFYWHQRKRLMKTD